MRLVDPSPVWKDAFLDMAHECAAAGDPRYALALDDFDAYLRKVENGRKIEGNPEGWIARTELWLSEDRTLVACARLRFWLTPDQEYEGGHLGYDVRPSRRRQGYGTSLLALALAEARGRGIGRVRITCDADNVGSIKIIERNGGAYAGSVISAETNKLVRQYWIEP